MAVQGGPPPRPPGRPDSAAPRALPRALLQADVEHDLPPLARGQQELEGFLAACSTEQGETPA